MDAKRVLIVEDEAIIGEHLRSIVKRLGYQVVGIASSGADAIRHAADQVPDLVLMDVRLSGDMDGMEAARRIRLARSIPIIYITAHASALRDKVPGPYRVAKPFSVEQIRSVIAEALES